MPIYKASH